MTMDDRLAADPDLVAMYDACAAYHRTFVALMVGGFTETQALRIIALAMTTGDADTERRTPS